MKKKCPKCDNLFDCQQDEPSCWCSSYPKFTTHNLDEELDCVCKECLRQMYFERLFPS